MKYAIQNTTTKKWLTYYGMSVWFTYNTAIRYEHDDPLYLITISKQLPDADRLIVLEVNT